MKIKDFKKLTPDEQKDIIEQNGVFLDYRSSGSYSIVLFQIDGFYVELFFHIIKLVCKKIRIFEDTVLLDPYINSIDITELCDCRHF
jgi:hypothetical protein